MQIGRAAAQGLLEPDLEETRKLVDKATPKPADPEPAKAKKAKRRALDKRRSCFDTHQHGS